MTQPNLIVYTDKTGETRTEYVITDSHRIIREEELEQAGYKIVEG